MTTIRNADGFAIANAGERHADFRRPTPMEYMTVLEDFVAAPSGIPSGWTHTTTNGTLAVASGTLLTQTLGGADNDLSQLYATTASLTIGTNKRAHFHWRGKVDKGAGGTIGQEEVYIGLAAVQTGTSFVAAAGTSLTVDDFIGFVSFDATTTMGTYCRKSDAESSEAAATTYADATYMELAFDYDGTTVTFYKDTSRVGQVTTNVPTAALVPMLYVKAGAGHAKVLTTDYIWAAIER